MLGRSPFQSQQRDDANLRSHPQQFHDRFSVKFPA
jgi:hypothetical protein